MENLRVLEGSEVFFRGLQHLYHQFESGWRLFLTAYGLFFCCGDEETLFLLHKMLRGNAHSREKEKHLK